MGTTLHNDWTGGRHTHGRSTDSRPGRIPRRGRRAAASNRPWPSRTCSWRRSHFGKMSILLLDIGNTNTHLGIANSSRLTRQRNIPTATWRRGQAKSLIAAFVGKTRLEGAVLCSVVPSVTGLAHTIVKQIAKVECLPLTSKTVTG